MDGDLEGERGERLPRKAVNLPTCGKLLPATAMETAHFIV